MMSRNVDIRPILHLDFRFLFQYNMKNTNVKPGRRFTMKYGIYYAYWEQEWKADYIRYIEKVAKLGFDILEIACTPLPGYSRQQLDDLRPAPPIAASH